MSRMKRIAQETLAALEHGAYTSPSGAVRELAEAQQAALEGTRLYRPDQLKRLVRSVTEGPAPTTEVWEGTTQAVARILVQEEGVADLALLNFASARNPGGGFLNGAQSQEEDLARASGLYPCLLTQPEYYEANEACRSMLYTDHVITSPGVPFFREGAAWLEEPFLASVITAPAPNARQHLARSPGGGGELRRTLQRRAGAVLAVARELGCRTVLLGAWGCGVFRNDPDDVADAFAHWIRGGVFCGAFDRIVFGIYDTDRLQRVSRAFEARFLEG